METRVVETNRQKYATDHVSRNKFGLRLVVVILLFVTEKKTLISPAKITGSGMVLHDDNW